MKRFRASSLLLLTGILIVLVFFGSQLQVPTAIAVPRLTSQNPVALGANTCAGGGCHSGTATPGGSVVVNFPSGMTYSPGVTQHLSVTVTDPTQTRLGFELTARLASALQAGTFANPGTGANLGTNGVQVVQGLANSPTFTFDWVPPASAAGNVTFYLTGLAGGCCSGDGVYTNMYTLTPVAAGPPDFSLSASKVTITDGASGSSTITVTPTNGFTGTIALSASGLPTGVSFSPTSITGTSMLTVTASSTATTGTFPVTLTGTSGSLSHTATFSLNVNAAGVPDFSLLASPSSLTITQGASGTSTITVTPQNGFTGSIALSASGLPTGVSFSPTSITGTSMLTVTASSTATTGTFPVTLTGTSGSLSHTTTVSLTVNAASVPSFALSGSPGSVSITQGTSGTSTVTVTPKNGFSASVSLSASGLPSGVTASFSPSSATTTTTLTLTVSSTAAQGTSTITITGTSGTLSAMTLVGLVVTAPPSILAASPTSVSFSYRLGTAAPPTQNIQVTASITPLAYTTSVSDPTWLSATPASGTTPGTVAIGIVPGTLQSGSYSGSVSISSIGALGSPKTIQVALTVTSEQLNSTTTGSSYPNLVIDGASNFNAAWIDSSAGLLFSRSINEGVLFSSPLAIPGSTGAAFQPQMVVDSTGNNVYLAWAATSTSTTGSYDVYESHSTNGGTTFLATPTKLSLSPIPLADGPRMAVGSTGIVSVVWGRDEADITQSSNGGGTFFAPIKISTVAQNSGGPRVAVDSKGTVYVVWTDEANKTASGSYCSSPSSTGTGTNGLPIYSNTSGGTVYVNITAPGTTPTATTSALGAVTYGTRSLSATDWKGTSANWPNGFFGCSYDNLQILVDSGDNVHIVWADDLPDESVFASAYPLAGGSPAANLFSFPSIVTTQPSASPYAAIDSTNNVNLVWSGGPGGSAATAGVFFSRSTDNVAPFGRTFTPPANVVSNSESPEFPQVAIDAGGNVDVVWQQNSTTTAGAFDVYFARSFDSGAGFSVTASPVSATPSMQCLNSSSVTTSQIPPPPFTTCGSVALGVDSGSKSDLIWIDRPSGQTISNVVFAHMTINSPLAPAPDFYMALAAPTQTGSPTAPASYSLRLTALYGFASSVTLTCSGLPAGASCAAIPAVTPATTGTAVIVNVGVTSSLAAGTYSFSITGASAAATHTVQASLVIAGAVTQDFTVGVPTTSQSVLAGTTANYSTNVMSVGGYSSPVTLTCLGLPTGASCAALSVTPTAAGASATVVVTVSTSVAAGIYSFSITGTSGTLSHVQFVTLTVGTVSGSVTPSTTTSIAVGASSTFTVLVSPSSGIGGTINLSCGGLVAGILCSFSPSSINLTGATARSTLTVSVTSKPAAVPGGAPNLPKRTGPGEIATGTAYAVLFLMVLAGIATSTREGQRSARLSRGLAVFAIVLISVTMISCAMVGTTPGPLSRPTTGGGSVTSQITVQAQSGTITTTLATLSITVP